MARRTWAIAMRPKEGYFPVAPNDTLQDLRTAMVLVMEDCGINVEAQHHEVAAGGQCEIDMRFDSLLTMADRVMLYKYIVKNVARRAGKSATFMPKPIFGDNGSGMHVHMSLWKHERPLFADAEGYAGVSEMARMFIGGLLTHAPAVLALARSEHEQLSASGAWLRGACQPRLLAAQPLRRRAYPDVFG